MALPPGGRRLHAWRVAVAAALATCCGLAPVCGAASVVELPGCVDAAVAVPLPPGQLRLAGLQPTAEHARHYLTYLWYELVVEVAGDPVVVLSGGGLQAWLPQPCASVGAGSGAVRCWVSPYGPTDLPVTVHKPGITARCVRQFAPWRPLALLIGVALLTLSPVVATSSLFYYVMAVALAGFILVVYMWRHPRRTSALGVAAAVVAAYLWPSVAVDHGFIATWGLTAAGAVCALTGVVLVYLFQPTKNQRFCNVVQWTMQFVGAVVITVQSTSEPVTRPWAGLATAVALVVVSLLDGWLPFGSPMSLVRRAVIGLPQRRLLSPEEYDAQMREATGEGMAQLRHTLMTQYGQYLHRLDPRGVHNLHDWVFMGQAPPAMDPAAPPPAFTVDGDGARHHPADAQEGDAEFEAWVAANEDRW